MNCPSCGAPMQLKADQESFRCDYCHSVYFPDKGDDGVRVLGGDPTDQACPICSVPLVNASAANTRILYCNKCHGMLVPMGALEDMVDNSRSTAAAGAAQTASDPADLNRKLACPRCHHPMDAHYYAGGGRVIVNSCEDCCLIWLDRGGLMRIAHAAAASATDSAEPEQSYAPVDNDPGAQVLDAVSVLLQTMRQMQR